MGLTIIKEVRYYYMKRNKKGHPQKRNQRKTPIEETETLKINSNVYRDLAYDEGGISNQVGEKSYSINWLEQLSSQQERIK